MAGQKTETTDVISGAIGVDVQRARALRTRCETLACWRYKRNPTNFYWKYPCAHAWLGLIAHSKSFNMQTRKPLRHAGRRWRSITS